ncbi:MAG: CHAT domain-containing protein [Cyanobacteria bacterium P01_D01_bin.156]
MAKWIRFLVVVGLTACLCGQALPGLAQMTRQISAEQSLAQTTPTQLIQQGREHYTEGRYAAAIEAWQQAAQSYERQADRVNQASALSNVGLAYLRLGNYTEADAAIATAHSQFSETPTEPYPQRILAQVLTAQAQLSMAQGQLNEALAHLNQATELYQTLEDPDGLLRAQLNQGQILQVQGRYRQALKQLENINETLTEDLDDSAIKAAGLRHLGNIQRFNGDADQALSSLRKSQQVAEAIGNNAELSSTLLSLGNLVAETSNAESIEYPEPLDPVDLYQRAAAVAPTPLLRLQAQVNLLGLKLSQNQLDSALLNNIQAELPQLRPGRTSNLIRLNLANHLIKSGSGLSTDELTRFLEGTLAQAEAIQDGQGQSYAWGYLGRLHEVNQQWEAAAEVTQKAWNLALGTNSLTALYQWQWQLGRVLAAQGDTQGAIAAYNQALETLQNLRSDLVSTSPDLQFSFREEVEPIYRELVSLLLKSEDPTTTAPDNLLKARDVIENLQVAELVNFFRADCVVTSQTRIDQVDTKAAVIYPIILEESVEIIASLPGESSEDTLKHYSTPINKDIFEQELTQLEGIIDHPPSSEALESLPEWETRSTPDDSRATVIPQRTGQGSDVNINFITPAKDIYDHLIRPITADLEATDTEVLVFVLDGTLRNVPMSVLYDGEQYLIEKYAIALTPGLQLIDPQPIARGQVKALVGGLSESVEGFSALPYVVAEVNAIKEQVPSDVLLDQDFEVNSFEDKLTTLPFPVVHLATHGKFSSDLEETFIQAWDGKINANELSSMLQVGEISRDETIELLILSACETAAGDDRAALGLAGIAVRSGARSTLATLWQVNDEGTSVLMSDLYRQLAQSSLTKAEILRQAQLNLLNNDDYRHPYFWAPFVLIGNWL